MFDTPVWEVTLLVVDPWHQRFGQTAELSIHDWRESGALYARFPDGGFESLREGTPNTDPFLPQALVIKTEATTMLLSIQRKLPDVRNKLASLAVVAKSDELPMELRIHAKKLFLKVLSDLE